MCFHGCSESSTVECLHVRFDANSQKGNATKCLVYDTCSRDLFSMCPGLVGNTYEYCIMNGHLCPIACTECFDTAKPPALRLSVAFLYKTHLLCALVFFLARKRRCKRCDSTEENVREQAEERHSWCGQMEDFRS